MSLLPKTQSVQLDWIRSTKNTEVYGTDVHSAVVNQLYIRKSAFSGDAPNIIKITIEEADHEEALAD